MPPCWVEALRQMGISSSSQPCLTTHVQNQTSITSAGVVLAHLATASMSVNQPNLSCCSNVIQLGPRSVVHWEHTPRHMSSVAVVCSRTGIHHLLLHTAISEGANALSQSHFPFVQANVIRMPNRSAAAISLSESPSPPACLQGKAQTSAP